MTLILGGGIGGLSAAHYLLKYSKNVVVAEASPIIGGWIKSVKDPRTGVIFEKGPRTIRVKGGANTLELIEDIGIASKVKYIKFGHPASTNRLIYVNGKLHFLPSSFSALFKTISPFSKPLIISLFKDLTTRKVSLSDDSIYNFVERRFGKEPAEYLFSAMICGICAGDAKKISVKFLMPQLFEDEQKYGSVAIGLVRNTLFKNKINEDPPKGLYAKAIDEKWNIFGMDGGLSSIPDQLGKNITNNGGKILLNNEVTELNFDKNGVKYSINGKTEYCERVISALPAIKLARLVKNLPWLSEQLSSFEFVTVVVVNLAYKGKVLNFDAFGFLSPPSQKLPVLGVIFDTCCFPQDDWTVLTVMMGGSWYDQYFGSKTTEEEYLDVAVENVKKILGIEAKPEAYHVDTMKDCISQYTLGHHERVDKIFNYVKEKSLPLSLIGSSYKGVGVNDVINSAKNAVAKIKSSLKE